MTTEIMMNPGEMLSLERAFRLAGDTKTAGDIRKRFPFLFLNKPMNPNLPQIALKSRQRSSGAQTQVLIEEAVSGIAAAEQATEPSCFVLLGSIGWIEVNLSTSRVKHLKKNNGIIPLVSPSGVPIHVAARSIKKISSKHP